MQALIVPYDTCGLLRQPPPLEALALGAKTRLPPIRVTMAAMATAS
jgi:hypothetical protein